MTAVSLLAAASNKPNTWHIASIDRILCFSMVSTVETGPDNTEDFNLPEVSKSEEISETAAQQSRMEL